MKVRKKMEKERLKIKKKDSITDAVAAHGRQMPETEKTLNQYLNG